MQNGGLSELFRILSEYINDTGNFGVILYIIEVVVGLLFPTTR